MRRCRKCNKEWPDTATACPDDGWSLTIEADMTAAPASGIGVGATMGTAQHAVAEADPSISQDLPPGTQVGEYRVERKIGEGGMGAVYAAVHPLIGKKAAIKVISSALGTDASAVQRFVQEARSVNQIGHPNIVDVFAFGTLPDGRNYFVMEHLQGEGLANRLQRASMSLGEAIEILDQVADALEAAHEKQIVHRDLKPDNVYLASVRGGRTMVKLLDFGIAKLSVADGKDGGSGVQKTRTGMMMGTPGYLSPEQARGKNVDHRTDIYALGCMTFEIACGRLPFVADNAMDIVLAHMTQPPPHPMEVWPDIPAPLADLILKMLDKHPDNRPTLAEIRSGFANLVTSGLVTLDASRPATFGSGLERRIQTPSRGLPTPPAGLPAVGTQPPGSIAVPAGTSPPVAGEVVGVAKKGKGGIVIAAVAGIVLIGGGAAFFAMKGGDSDSAQKPAQVAQPPAPAPTPPPAPPPAPPPVEKTVAKPTKGTLDVTVDAAGALITIDGAAHAAGKAEVDAGRHTIVATADGYERYEQPWTVEVGQTTPVAIKMKKVEVAKKGPIAAGVPKKPPASAGAGSAAKPVGSASKPAGKTPGKDKDAPEEVQF